MSPSPSVPVTPSDSQIQDRKECTPSALQGGVINSPKGITWYPSLLISSTHRCPWMKIIPSGSLSLCPSRYPWVCFSVSVSDRTEADSGDLMSALKPNCRKWEQRALCCCNPGLPFREKRDKRPLFIILKEWQTSFSLWEKNQGSKQTKHYSRN